ncbi:MAG: SUMF1/EgtB/PvdO family nonheme iron enzyme, partial [Anaerolineae bacterium]|nr:SUMF1/EgtB/PvdO family nonheme iron enzyme [Anaerolineae bacterium]
MTRIFISYRRDDAGGYSLLIFDRLVNHFGRGRVFMDIDTIEPGVDFVDIIEKAVGSCDSLIALIGKQWLDMSDETGERRLDTPEDFVRLEIAAALERNIRVIPVLVRGAKMPSSDELPEPLKPLARRHAVELSDERIHYDLKRLVDVLQRSRQRTEEQPRSWLDRLERVTTAEHERVVPSPPATRPSTVPPRPTRLLFEPDTVEIPAGPFLAGEDKAEVGLPAFAIGHHPVKVIEFRAFVQSGGYSTPQFWTKAGWNWKEGTLRREPDYWGDGIWTDNEWLPVVGISWYEAYAYCRWLADKTGWTYRLPTTLEWEKAARGTDGRLYPWGNIPKAGLCNTYSAGIGHTTQTGAYSPGGDSPYGLTDMIGNVAEWCSTKWRKNSVLPPNDDPEGPAVRVLCGGSWSAVQIPPVYYHHRASPDTSYN